MREATGLHMERPDSHLPATSSAHPGELVSHRIADLASVSWRGERANVRHGLRRWLVRDTALPAEEPPCMSEAVGAAWRSHLHEEALCNLGGCQRERSGRMWRWECRRLAGDVSS